MSEVFTSKDYYIVETISNGKWICVFQAFTITRCIEYAGKYRFQDYVRIVSPKGTEYRRCVVGKDGSLNEKITETDSCVWLEVK